MVIIRDILEEEVINGSFKEGESQRLDDKFDSVQHFETEEVLDNLGYVRFDKNSPIDVVNSVELINGIEVFRQEFLQYKSDFPEYPITEDSLPQGELTDEELQFLSDVSSLEGKFELHQFSLERIEQNKILLRVLNFRFSMLSISVRELKIVNGNIPITNQFSGNTEKCLSKIGYWCNIKNPMEVVRLLGDVPELTKVLAKRKRFPGNRFNHIVFFKNRVDSKLEKKFKRSDDEERFESRFSVSNGPYKTPYRELTNKKKSMNDFIANNELNRFMIRLVQIRLFLLGTYGGRLDNDLGPMSLAAIIDLRDYIHEIRGTHIGIAIVDFIVFVKKKFWAINTKFLVQEIFPLIEEVDDDLDYQNSSISNEVDDLIYGSEMNGHEKNKVVRELDKMIEEDFEKEPSRKVRTRGGKGFFKSIKNFFQKVGRWIKTAFEKVIGALRKLFKWIKNGIKVLVREIRQAFHQIKTGIAFFFSRRRVKTPNKDPKMTSDFDFDFDSVTYISTMDKSLVREHIERNKEVADSLETASNFLGTVINVAINIAKGPLGWIKLAIRAIKALGRMLFTSLKPRFA